MKNKSDIPSEEKSESTLGKRLVVAREKLRLSQEAVAADLHWEVRVIAQLEGEAFDQMPPTSYVRGYLRSYASYLGLPPDPLIAQFNKLVGESEDSGKPQTISLKNGDPPLRGYSYFGLLLLLLVALGALYSVKDQWLKMLSDSPISVPTSLPTGLEGESNTSPVASADNTAAETSVPAGLVSAPELPPVSSPSAEILEPHAPEEERPLPQAQHLMEEPPVASTSLAAEQVKELPDSESLSSTVFKVDPNRDASVPEVGPGDGSVLEVRLTGDSWMDLRDSEGKKLLFGTKTSGSKHLISAKLPIKGTVGNYTHVKIEYNGAPLSLEPFGTTGVARLIFSPSKAAPAAAPNSQAPGVNGSFE